MNDIFLKACRGERVPHTPVWIMRQAGRYLKQYQQVRKTVDFLTLCKTPELAAKVTIQPIDALGVDAAILFSDILIPVEAMGLGLKFSEKIGPQFSNPVRDSAGLKKLRIPDPENDLGFVMETIRILRRELAGRVPLIGFAGAPFTTSTYMIEGGTSKNFLNTKRMMFQNPKLYAAIMDKITQALTEYLKGQIAAGAQALQLFDSWGGALSPADFKIYALPYVKEIIKNLRKWQIQEKKQPVPIIYFVGECAGVLEDIKDSGADVAGIDWRISIDAAIKRLGSKISVQGNLDPCALFLPKEKIQERVKDVLTKAKGARGHIFNLGHGILPETPVESAVAVVEAVHKYSGGK
ncbi:MAG: uroporphyrinogen decarboxylase [Nitrospirae bacterium]|nr:uroporphyrinogen decarboxylase [Nitrospirota bacterium]MBI4838355.1 uroporphyrinogen decarboxylase [Nitrospirota bacterium]